MAGQHNLHNHQIALKFPHQVWRQIEIDAEKLGAGMSSSSLAA